MRPLAAALLLGLAHAGAAPVISEIMFHPAPENGSEDRRHEWIEIHNPGFEPLSLRGWSLEGVDYTFPDVSIPRRGFLVVASDVATFQARYPDVFPVTGNWPGHLPNHRGTIRLLNPEGIEIDELAYADNGDWALRRRGPEDRGHSGWSWNNPAAGGGSSLELQSLTARNDIAQNWTASLLEGGTPGTRNSAHEVNIAPFIEGVSHHPAVPAPDDLVVVTAHLSDDLSPAVHGELHHRVSVLPSAEFTITPMRDDGLGGDAVAGDHIHTAVLPARPEGTVVEFFVKALVRSQGLPRVTLQSRTWPGPTSPGGDQEANLLYQVDSEQDRGPTPFYRLILSAPELAELESVSLTSQDRDTNALFNATFIAGLDGEHRTYYQCGLRLRGTSARASYPRSLKLELPSTHHWQGWDELNLNSRFTYNQLLGSVFYRAAGLPIYASKAVQVRLNGLNHAAPENARLAHPFEHHFGIYVHNQPIIGDYASEHYPLDPGGNLYRKTGTGTSWDHFPDSSDPGRDYRRAGWSKENNKAANDWSDLHRFMQVMTTSPGQLSQVESVMDLDSWLRTLAVSTILTNSEHSIFTGRNDKYALYGGSDGRFKLIAHDLDTILGSGGESSIGMKRLPFTILDFVERGESFSQLEELFRRPEVLQRYYQTLSDLLTGPFAQDRAELLIDETLTWTPPSIAESAKQFLAARRTNILSMINRPLQAATALNPVGGLPTTNDGSADLTGTWNITRAVAVSVNGSPATLDHATGSWQYSLSGLHPGINRLVIEEWDAQERLTAQTHLDIHHESGGGSMVSGNVSSDTTLAAADGPWYVTSPLNVLPGVTLSIEPGTSLFFTPAGGITVQPGGVLLCAGTRYDRIRLGRIPGSNDNWQGISIEAPTGQDSDAGNEISFTDFDAGDAQGECIALRRSRLLLDQVTWSNSSDTVLELYRPKLEIRDCSFPSIPTSRAIQGNTLRNDDFLLIHRNSFEASSAYNDIILFSGASRPGPILAAYDNLFNGATDECFDLNDCDAHLEGNVFMRVHLLQPRNTISNAIAIDDESDVTVVRNLFYDVDHAVLLKNGATCTFENNTVVGATVAAISFDEPLRQNTLPGGRLDMDSNLFVDCRAILAHAVSVPPEDDPIISGHRNNLPGQYHWIGEDNLSLDPFLVRPGTEPQPKWNWSLLHGSPARGSGQNGLDRGALISRGVTVSGLPTSTTPFNHATLKVDGAGMAEYRYRLVTDGIAGPWSARVPLATPLQLTGLLPASYHVDLLGGDSAGNWQPESEFTSSPEWRVEPGLQDRLILSEVEARRKPAVDTVEIYNPGTQAVLLDDWFLTDDPDNPDKVALSGSIAPRAYLTLADGEVPGLSESGEELHLFHGRTKVDSIRWGNLLAGHSLGRSSPNGTWTLCHPTPGAPNRPAGLTPSRYLRINEWLSRASVRYRREFIEIYNPGDSPADLGNLWLSNSPDQTRLHRIPVHSYLPPGGFSVFHPAAGGAPAANEMPFHLHGFHQWLILADRDGNPIDRVAVNSQQPDVVEGRNPDGSHDIEVFPLGTPGRSNDRDIPLLNISTPLPFQLADWRFLDASSEDPLEDWRIPEFDDSSWKQGPAPLGRETSVLPVPLATHGGSEPQFNYRRGKRNFYFRRTFEFNGEPSRTSLTLETYLDDGAVFYLNGAELYRHNMPEGLLGDDSWAVETVTNAGFAGPFPVPSGPLVKGTNTLAVITYQATASSSDIVFDCELTASETAPAPPDPTEASLQLLLEHLRVTEIMYNPPDGSNGEYIEIQNTSRNLTLELEGVRFTEGIEFTFPAATLGPREHIAVVSDLEFFELIHGRGINVAGEFESGKLHNDSESVTLSLPSPFEINIQKFTYNHRWHPATDAAGYSLELRDPGRGLATWNEGSAWTPSPARHGSPGAPNGASSFSSWASALGARPGDDDSDGLSGPFEYAFGFNPFQHQSVPVLLEQIMHPLEGSTTTYHVPAIAPADITFHLQSSEDLRIWTNEATRIANGPWTGPGQVESLQSGAGLGMVRLHHQDKSVLFTRLKVEVINTPPPGRRK